MNANDERRTQIEKVAGLEREVFAQVHPMDRNGHLVREFAHEVRALLELIASAYSEGGGRDV